MKIQSFTAYCLLNRRVLDFFEPSDRLLVKIKETTSSVLDTLSKSTQRPWSNIKNAGYLYLAHKFFLLTIFKVAYVAFITTFVARLGVVYNAFLTILSYVKYRLGKSENIETNWQKVNAYANAFLGDLVCTFLGSGCTWSFFKFGNHLLHMAKTGVLGPCHATSDFKIKKIFAYSVVFLLAFTMLSNFQHPEVAPHLFAQKDEMTGMYISLCLRKWAGLVDNNGNLLPFSQKDRFEFHVDRERFEGDNYNNFYDLIVFAEKNLVRCIKDINTLLGNSIPFSYPFDVNAIIKKLEEKIRSTSVQVVSSNSNSLGTTDSAFQLKFKLVNLAQQLKILRILFHTCKKMTTDDSLIMHFIKSALGISSVTWDFKHPKVYTFEDAYRELFTTEIDYSKDIKSIPPLSIDPNLGQRPQTDNAYEQFKYDVGANQWYLNNNQQQKMKSDSELLGFTEQTPYIERHRKINILKVRLHPDLHQTEKEIVGALYVYFLTICEKFNQKEEGQP